MARVAAPFVVLLVMVLVPALQPGLAGQAWQTPRTSWGHADLSGTWSTATITPLERPVELAGNSLKQFKCRTCDKSFSKSRGRIAHEKRHGENLTTAKKKEEEKELAKITKIKNRSYPCSHPDCDKTYKSRKARWLHGKSHQGKKKFGCTYENCQERFDTFLERKEHFREHDRQSREREEAERNLLEEEIYLRGYSAAFQKWVAVFNELRRREALAMLKHELPTL